MRQLTGRHVLFALIGFFGVIIAVNMVMVVLALESWTGLSDQQSYRKGLAYNETLARAEAQAALGWRSTVSVAAAADGTHRVGLALVDAAGAPLVGQEVSLRLIRPVGEYPPVETALAEDGAGLYAAEVRLPMAGNWQAEFRVRRDDGDFIVRERIWAR